ncbi:MAG TPA: hypothetical protein HPP87_03860 [Planctomycetes bacterium]|nr:hypothetical protein [Planctomycetota bacterium]
MSKQPDFAGLPTAIYDEIVLNQTAKKSDIEAEVERFSVNKPLTNKELSEHDGKRRFK